MSDIEIIYVSSKKNIAEECICCYENKNTFQDYGCQHKICIDCHNTMNKKLGRNSCLYCDPLPTNTVTINISPRVTPSNTVTINEESAKSRKCWVDFICFLCCFYSLFPLGFIFRNIIYNLDNEKNIDIFDFNEFTFGNAFTGVCYILLLLYILITILLLVDAIRVRFECITVRDNDELPICKKLSYFLDVICIGYNQFKNCICCVY